MKQWERKGLLVLIAMAIAAIAMSLELSASKCLATASLILALAALIQGSISGLFEKLMDIYGDEKIYPFGPPSSFVRETIDDPDTPLRNAVSNYLFNGKATAAHLAAASIFIQIVATWL